MASTVPILVLAYNRPENLTRLLIGLERVGADRLHIAVDGPKSHIPGDVERVDQVRAVANSIAWTENVVTQFRDENVGLRAAVVESVSRLVSEHGRVIVLEDDIVPGPQLLPFLREMLDKYASDSRVEHVSGYDMVPPSARTFQDLRPRLSRYPESYAWATWERAWLGYDDSLEWALNASVADLTKIVGSRVGALRWKQNFGDAAAGRISTWAYRWMASMWSRNSFMISPGANLAHYAGRDSGTHTILATRWKELPVYDGSLNPLVSHVAEYDNHADRWAAHHVYDETLYGVARGVAISAVLELRKRHRARRLSRSSPASHQ